MPLTFSAVPSYYRDLKEVSNKSRATSPSLHRPYDCTIDHLPGSTPPLWGLFSLSAPERQAIDDYISESLAAGLIRPSCSLAGAGFFFTSKKDGGLHLCIDYHGLNDITIKNKYHLPPICSVFELLQGACIFKKPDLRNAYHLVRIRERDEWRTAYKTPSGHYESCPTASQTHLQFSKTRSMMLWEIWSTNLSLFTRMTFWFSLIHCLNMSTMPCSCPAESNTKSSLR